MGDMLKWEKNGCNMDGNIFHLLPGWLLLLLLPILLPSRKSGCHSHLLPSPLSSWQSVSPLGHVNLVLPEFSIPLPSISSSGHCHLFPGFSQVSSSFPMGKFGLPKLDLVLFRHQTCFSLSLPHLSESNYRPPSGTSRPTIDTSLFLTPNSIIQVRRIYLLIIS